MRRFNRAVERADELFDGKLDRSDVNKLLWALRFPAWMASTQCRMAADELQAAAEAIYHENHT